MMTFSARSYNQRFTVLNTHQCLTTVQMRYHSYAREGFGDAVMAKCGHKNAQTPYIGSADAGHRGTVGYPSFSPFLSTLQGGQKVTETVTYARYWLPERVLRTVLITTIAVVEMMIENRARKAFTVPFHVIVTFIAIYWKLSYEDLRTPPTLLSGPSSVGS